MANQMFFLGNAYAASRGGGRPSEIYNNDTKRESIKMENKKSIFIEAREWFDKSGGNSYFAGRVEVDGQLVAWLPFQYGYESAYRDAAFKELQRLGIVPMTVRSFWQLQDAGFVVYSVKYEAKYKDTKRFGQPWEVAA
jgi:hypothetical protein